MKKRPDLPAQAILDYHRGERGNLIYTRINGIPDQPMDPAIFFRNGRHFKAFEKTALRLCRGRILDVGAGAGCHSLWLQQKGYDVTALEISALAASVCTERGVRNTLCEDVMNLQGQSFDTILLLMNGLGISGTIESTKLLFKHLKTLLRKNGQIIGDSSDILYHIAEQGKTASNDPYYGEVTFELTYKTNKLPGLNWVYLDISKLKEICKETGFSCEIYNEDNNDHYLARLRHK